MQVPGPGTARTLAEEIGRRFHRADLLSILAKRMIETPNSGAAGLLPTTTRTYYVRHCEPPLRRGNPGAASTALPAPGLPRRYASRNDYVIVER